jgi:peptidoglycan/xylan/chitin deacetylase (PgdA/CDA1 family)
MPSVSPICRAQVSELAGWAAGVAVRLHEALAKAGVRNEFVTIHGGGRGGFPRGQVQDAYTRINAFLKAQGVIQQIRLRPRM